MQKFFLNSNKSEGYAIIFSVVVISVIVIVTLAVASLVQRELELSSIGRQSMEAFFAADAGIECALMADVRGRNSTPFARSGTPTSDRITCNGSQSGRIIRSTCDSKICYDFEIREGFCANVRVEIDGTRTVIESTGFNMSGGTNCNLSSADTVQRGLEVRY